MTAVPAPTSFRTGIRGQKSASGRGNGRVAMLFEGRSPAELGAFGELRTPSIADLFVAKMQERAST